MFKNKKVWFITGSQHLYGPKVLSQVAENSQNIVKGFNSSKNLNLEIIYKPTVKTAEEIRAVCSSANNDADCVGVIFWMHTFSPSKMWIGGLSILQKPVLHLHTQFNRDLPWQNIDMDFMNLNQSAHGDREHGYIHARLRRARKIVVGFWQEPAVQNKIDTWVRAALAWNDWQGAKFARFGDNMRNVAVTEGDKVAAEIRLGYSVNYHPLGDLVEVINNISVSDVEKLCQSYEDEYNLQSELKKGGARYQELITAGRIELGIYEFLKSGNFHGYTNTFEDLHGMAQLPGIATQRLMAKGYGFGAEGDWKTCALVRAMKVMANGRVGGVSFMEDYTYHLDNNEPLVLGAHMLEVCPSIASAKPSAEIHKLGIGGKNDPVRLVFNARAGKGINATMMDMGNRFRLLVNDINVIEPPASLPKLPVARAVWQAIPNFEISAHAWILAGGAHHSGFTTAINAEHLEDFAEIAGIEMVHINSETTIRDLKNTLRWNDVAYKVGEFRD